jgi:hypothetical protein
MLREKKDPHHDLFTGTWTDLYKLGVFIDTSASYLLIRYFNLSRSNVFFQRVEIHICLNVVLI